MKRRLFLLVMLLLLPLAVFSARAEEPPLSGTCGENLNWVLTEVSEVDEVLYDLCISGTGAMDDYHTEDAFIHPPWVEAAACIRTLTVEEGVTGIGDAAFFYCNIPEIVLPDSLERIGEYAFYGNPDLKEITVPGCPGGIGEQAFANCASLKKIVFREGTAEIGPFGLEECGQLETVSLPASLQQMGECIFSGCRNLKEVILAPGCRDYLSDDGVIYDRERTSLIFYPPAKTDTTYTIPESVWIVENSAFHNASLTGIEMFYRTGNIMEHAFAACPNLKEIRFAGTEAEWAGVSVKEDNAPFEQAEVHFSSPAYAWTMADGILTVSGDDRIPCFDDHDAPWYEAREEITRIVVGEGIRNIGSHAFADCVNAASLELPDTLEIIDAGAFKGCASLQAVKLPDGVRTLYGSVFSGCASLTEVTLSPALTVINYFLFDGCSALKEITVPDGVTEICAFAFRNCAALETVRLPAGVTEIGMMAFDSCGALKEILFAGTAEQWAAVRIGDGNAPLSGAEVRFP